MFKQIILISLIAITFQVDNCDEPLTACSSCIDGYTLVEAYEEGPYCIKDDKLAEIKKVDPNCLKLDENDPSKCSVCTIDYLPSKKKGGKECISRPKCEEIDDNDVCTECLWMFYLNSEGNCEKRYPCKEINKDGSCKTCVDYYYLNEKNECKKIPLEYCLEGNSTHCTKCDIEKHDNRHLYLNKEGKCVSQIAHCTSYEKDNKCSWCDSENYYLDGQVCKEATKVEHCQSYAQTENKCSYCEPSYYIDDDNTCKPIQLEHCNHYNKENDQCDSCEKYYYVKDGKCEKIPIANCENLDDSDPTKCDECDDAYELSEDNSECITFCKSTQVLCDDCMDNYVTFDNFRTCTKIDQDLKTEGEENGNKFIYLNSVIFVIMILFIL